MWADNETKVDLLGYQVHAELLSKVVLDSTMLPVSIGIFGDWGSGKSSLMLLLYETIEAWKKEPENNRKKVLQIKFNSWQFEDYEDTKLTLIDTILSSIQNDIAEHLDIFEKADNFFKKIKYLKLGVYIIKKGAWKLVPSEIKELLPTEDEFNDFEEDDAKFLRAEVAKGNTSNFIARFYNDFSELVKSSGYQSIIVYIDDLDRCSPERIIQCLEAVKLFVNVDQTAFIIGADEGIIENAITERYKSPIKQKSISSPYSDYLEKLIQLPYKLPKLSYSEQETYITLLMCYKYGNPNLFSSVQTKFQSFRKKDKHTKYDWNCIKRDNKEFNFGKTEDLLGIIPIMNKFLNGNPRQLKRFLNTFDMRRKMAEVAGFDDIRPDILVKLMVLEYNSELRNNVDDLYSRQKESGVINNIEEVEKQAKGGLLINEDWKSAWSKVNQIRWLASEPSFKNINLQNYFWISREALKQETPIESRVTRAVTDVYNRLKRAQTEKTLKPMFNNEISKLSLDELTMMAILLHNDLQTDVTSSKVLMFLNVDNDDKVISSVELMHILFEGIDFSKLEPGYSTFFKRKSSDPACKKYIQQMNLNINLKRAMK